MQVLETVRFTYCSEIERPEFGSIAVQNLHPEFLAELHASVHLLGRVFRVTVVHPEDASDDTLPAVSGRNQLVEGGVRFTPHFPFEPGMVYLATFDPRLLTHGSFSDVLTMKFALPAQPVTYPAEVTAVFPTSDSLPENLLRFYVNFSDSMQRGRAEAEIRLLDSDGRPAADVLYRAPVELWDRGMRKLTILLDPGRLKRGVGPNVELGPPLKVGQRYSLAIGSGMLNRSGQSLRVPFLKHFHVTEPVRERIDIARWKLSLPDAGSRKPLLLFFPASLDLALLRQSISVTTAEDQPLAGQIEIGPEEMQWSFTPTTLWLSGSYRVHISSSLEDVCGNNILGPFDRPMRLGTDLLYDVTKQVIDFSLL